MYKIIVENATEVATKLIKEHGIPLRVSDGNIIVSKTNLAEAEDLMGDREYVVEGSALDPLHWNCKCKCEDGSVCSVGFNTISTPSEEEFLSFAQQVADHVNKQKGQSATAFSIVNDAGKEFWTGEETVGGLDEVSDEDLEKMDDFIDSATGDKTDPAEEAQKQRDSQELKRAGDELKKAMNNPNPNPNQAKQAASNLIGKMMGEGKTWNKIFIAEAIGAEVRAFPTASAREKWIMDNWEMFDDVEEHEYDVDELKTFVRNEIDSEEHAEFENFAEAVKEGPQSGVTYMIEATKAHSDNPLAPLYTALKEGVLDEDMTAHDMVLQMAEAYGSDTSKWNVDDIVKEYANIVLNTME